MNPRVIAAVVSRFQRFGRFAHESQDFALGYPVSALWA